MPMKCDNSGIVAREHIRSPRCKPMQARGLRYVLGIRTEKSPSRPRRHLGEKLPNAQVQPLTSQKLSRIPGSEPRLLVGKGVYRSKSSLGGGLDCSRD